MIRRVTLRRFKRFGDVTFDLPGHVVLAGPNNTGKTTLLQAIAAWELAFRRWHEVSDVERRNGVYDRVPIARQAFTAVPLLAFDLLWTDRTASEPIAIELADDRGWSVAMEFLPDTTEQCFVRPASAASEEHVGDFRRIRSVFVPPASGINVEEPLYANRATVGALLSRFRSGDLIRNLLVEAQDTKGAWPAVVDGMQRLFGCELIAPDRAGAFITAGYRERQDGPVFDLPSAGSGFHQVLLLLCLLHCRPNSIFLLDEPDAHLHVLLQDAVFAEVRACAARSRSQLIIATHSEVMINAADLSELRVSFDPSRELVAEADRERLKAVLAHLSNFDVLEAKRAAGVIYVEDYTDIEILREWAKALRHPAYALLAGGAFWRKTVIESGEGAGSIHAREHYDALRMVRADLPGVVLVDGDARASIGPTAITGRDLQRLRWRRYEIESYLVHPASLARFVALQFGGDDAARESKRGLERELARVFRAEFLHQPFAGDPLVEAYFQAKKARTDVLPPLLAAAGLPSFPYTRFREIAAVMTADEIHPEVREKLDLLCKALGR